MSAADPVANHGGRVHGIIQHNGQTAADIGPCYFFKGLGPAIVQNQLDVRPFNVYAGTHAGIGHPITREQGLSLQGISGPDRLPAQRVAILTIQGLGFARTALFRHQLEFQYCGSADQFLGAFRVLDTGQLNQNIPVALTLNNGLCHAELVDPVANGFQGLIDCVLVERFDLAAVEVNNNIRARTSGHPRFENRETIGKNLPHYRSV